MGLSNLSIRWRHLSVNFSSRKLTVFSSYFSIKMNNVHNTMSSDNAVSGKYPAPTTINNMLEARFNHSFDNTFKYGLAVYICTVFTAIVSSLMWYAFITFGLAGAGLGVAGAVFFDKEGVKLSMPKFSAPASTPSEFTESKLE